MVLKLYHDIGVEHFKFSSKVVGITKIKENPCKFLINVDNGQNGVQYLCNRVIIASTIDTIRKLLPSYPIYNDIEGQPFLRLYAKFTKSSIPVLKEYIKDIPNEYIISREEFQEVTKVRSEHLAREINKVRRSLKSKTIETPHPLDMKSTDSGSSYTWFTELSYLNKTGELYIEINRKILDRIIAFVTYAKINFKYVANIKNHNAIRLYISLKHLMSAYRKNSIQIGVDEFKDKMNLLDKYRSFQTFREKVLEVIKIDLNNYSDIFFDYELYKTGRRFTDITLKFSQKKDISKQLDQSKCQPQEIEHQATDALNIDINDQDIIIAAQLQSYGIPRNKALEYIKTYGTDTCKVGIEKLLGEIQKGRDIKNISGYLVSCIENAGNNSSSQEIKAAMDAAEELAQDRKAQEMERFNSFDTYVNNNEQQILVLLARHQANDKLTDELEIDMLRCLKDVVAQYEDLESMSPYYLTLRFKGDILNYSKIKSLVEELEVATKEERIAKLKAELEAKKVELEKVGGKAKGLVEKEITMLKVAIADLV